MLKVDACEEFRAESPSPGLPRMHACRRIRKNWPPRPAAFTGHSAAIPARPPRRCTSLGLSARRPTNVQRRADGPRRSCRAAETSSTASTPATTAVSAYEQDAAAPGWRRRSSRASWSAAGPSCARGRSTTRSSPGRQGISLTLRYRCPGDPPGVDVELALLDESRVRPSPLRPRSPAPGTAPGQDLLSDDRRTFSVASSRANEDLTGLGSSRSSRWASSTSCATSITSSSCSASSSSAAGFALGARRRDGVHDGASMLALARARCRLRARESSSRPSRCRSPGKGRNFFVRDISKRWRITFPLDDHEVPSRVP